MNSAETHRDGAILERPDDSIGETQALRRKVVFWRRVAGLALGGVGIVMLVVWTRGQTRQRECHDALLGYAEKARSANLAEQHPDILEQQWQEFEQNAKGIPADHYDLIVKNWVARQGPEGDPVLAVCRDSHLLVFTSGRHVLKRHGDGFKIEWLSEEAAAPITAEARKDNRLQ